VEEKKKSNQMGGQSVLSLLKLSVAIKTWELVWWTTSVKTSSFWGQGDRVGSWGRRNHCLSRGKQRAETREDSELGEAGEERAVLRRAAGHPASPAPSLILPRCDAAAGLLASLVLVLSFLGRVEN